MATVWPHVVVVATLLGAAIWLRVELRRIAQQQAALRTEARDLVAAQARIMSLAFGSVVLFLVELQQELGGLRATVDAQRTEPAPLLLEPYRRELEARAQAIMASGNDVLPLVAVGRRLRYWATADIEQPPDWVASVVIAAAAVCRLVTSHSRHGTSLRVTLPRAMPFQEPQTVGMTVWSQAVEVRHHRGADGLIVRFADDHPAEGQPTFLCELDGSDFGSWGEWSGSDR